MIGQADGQGDDGEAGICRGSCREDREIADVDIVSWQAEIEAVLVGKGVSYVFKLPLQPRGPKSSSKEVMRGISRPRKASDLRG